jgi:hypothetical protein
MKNLPRNRSRKSPGVVRRHRRCLRQGGKVRRALLICVFVLAIMPSLYAQPYDGSPDAKTGREPFGPYSKDKRIKRRP